MSNTSFSSFLDALQDIPKGRLLALDIGKKKIGSAISDPSKKLAFPHKLILRNNYLDELQKIVSNENIIAIVLGWPLHLSCDVSSMCDFVEKIAIELKEHFDLPIYYQDERLTTQASHRSLDFCNIHWKKKKQYTDALSASYILQMVLDRLEREQNIAKITEQQESY